MTSPYARRPWTGSDEGRPAHDGAHTPQLYGLLPLLLLPLPDLLSSIAWESESW